MIYGPLSCRDLMTSELVDCFACSVLWFVSEWIVSLTFAFYRNHVKGIDADPINMRLFGFGNKQSGEEANGEDDSSRCARTESERTRQKIQEGVRTRIYSRIIILPVIAWDSLKELTILRNSTEDMAQVPLIGTEENGSTESSIRNMVILEVGRPGDTWTYCVGRQRLAEKSQCFRTMLLGPLAPAPSDPPPVLRLQHVDKRAFDHLLRYLLDETINFHTVTMAKSTLHAAHQYLCPGLVRLIVEFLERNLTPITALEIYEGLALYANHISWDPNWSSNSPTAPPAPGDDAAEIAAVCTRLLLACLDVIDSDPETVFCQEYFQELSSTEVKELVSRDTLRLTKESILFEALDRWAMFECRRNGVKPTASNKRAALSDDVWYSVRYLLMTDREFIEGPMASGIFFSEESAYIVARILGHTVKHEEEKLRNSVTGTLPKLISTPRMGTRMCEDQSYKISKPGKKECQDNRKNRRKECANQGQKTCARIGNCLVRVLACIFD
ncbi:uncharacterized protein LOC126915282 isoform X2 [Bombus affinis]|uniref:uncharacterized protein LOC126915282 isoform X2 n=1 Tax=Bombus affinis TaxID=309941 RepID=UPI0021B747DC|nr:uncharacterized protein LOC126915282 isoform X2 [Bombus affinis]